MKFKTVILLMLLATHHISCLTTEERSRRDLPDPLEAGWEGESVCEVLEENEKIRVLKCTFPPNVGHEFHYHDEHFGYTLDGGKFEITDATGTREVNVPAGFSFYNEKILVHEVLNIGNTTATFLIVEPKNK